MGDGFYRDTDPAVQPEYAQPADGSGMRGAAMGVTAAGGAATAYAQFQAGKTNQKIARFNARQAEIRADQTIQAGDFAARRRAMVQAQLAGRTISGQAAGGTVVGAGTNRMVVADQENGSAMDQFMIKLNAARAAEGDHMQASADTLQGNMARRAGESGAIGSLLATGSDEWLLSDSSFDPRFGRGVAVGGR